jgi:hypothetical protein
MANIVILKCAALSEQDKANLEYINAQNLDEVTSPSYARLMALLGGVGGTSAATGAIGGGLLGSAVHGGGVNIKNILRGAIKPGLVGAGIGGAAGLGLGLLSPHFQKNLNEEMKEQRDEILSRQ